MQVIRKFILCILLAAASSACAKTDCETVNKINASLTANKPVAVIITDPNVKEDIEFSDAYGDWVEYWNNFIQDTQGKYLHIKMNPEQLPLVFTEYDKFNKPISYVFISKETAFYYDGPIYEPQVYLYVMRYFAGEKISKRIAAYKPERLQVKLHACW